MLLDHNEMLIKLKKCKTESVTIFLRWILIFRNSNNAKAGERFLPFNRYPNFAAIGVTVHIALRICLYVHFVCRFITRCGEKFGKNLIPCLLNRVWHWTNAVVNSDFLTLISKESIPAPSGRRNKREKLAWLRVFLTLI